MEVFIDKKKEKNIFFFKKERPSLTVNCAWRHVKNKLH